MILSSSYYLFLLSSSIYFINIGSGLAGLGYDDIFGLSCTIYICGYLTAPPWARIFYFVFFAKVPGVAWSTKSSSLGLWESWCGFTIGLLFTLCCILTGLPISCYYPIFGIEAGPPNWFGPPWGCCTPAFYCIWFWPC